MHDLLHDRFISIRMPGGATEQVCLPELLGRLCAGQVQAYAGLRAHQADPWHVFLVQIGASVLARQPDVDPKDPPADTVFWRAGLLDLADGHESAWHLVVEDLTLPAFLQHPLPGGKAELDAAFAIKASAADKIDVLVTAKNHDLKALRAPPSSVEPWLYAVICLQTTSGFLGAGNWGSVRMNGGFGSRAVVSSVSSNRPDTRFKEELHFVHQLRSQIRDQGFGYATRGLVLTWLHSWSRQDHQCALHHLEPYFVEAVRPLRLIDSGGGILAMCATSKARQVGPKAVEAGLVGDPWTVINASDKKKGRSALTLSASGWTPERLTEILFEQGYELTPLQRARLGTGDLRFMGSVVVRGQGTTDGFHAFDIPIPAKARSSLLQPAMAQPLGHFGLELIKDAREAERSLHAALFALVEGGPDQVIFKRDGLAAWVSKASQGFGAHWSERYFDSLWQAIDPDHRPAVRVAWRDALVTRARQALLDAESRLPLPVGRRWRALTRANTMLHGALRKADLLPAGTSKADEPQDRAHV